MTIDQLVDRFADIGIAQDSDICPRNLIQVELVWPFEEGPAVLGDSQTCKFTLLKD